MKICGIGGLMKFSLFKNDKTTAKDELLLLLFIIACLLIGVPLFALAPEFWIVTSSMTKIFGLVWILAAVMFVPGLIYRLMTNTKN